MGSSCGLNLLYLQAVSDMEMGCWTPTNEQHEKLRLLQETGQKKEGTSTGNPSEEDGIKLELSFEYCYGNDTWKWITIHTHQAFLLSTFMHQVGAEHAAKNLEMNSEMHIEMPDVQIKKKQSFFQYMKTDKARPILTRIKSAVRRSKEDNVFEGIEDKDL
ncbi:UNVERIFIED_CONTAM: hypothetical protein FKN15_037891 [Acipenser sinensis]